MKGWISFLVNFAHQLYMLTLYTSLSETSNRVGTSLGTSGVIYERLDSNTDTGLINYIQAIQEDYDSDTVIMIRIKFHLTEYHRFTIVSLSKNIVDDETYPIQSWVTG